MSPARKRPDEKPRFQTHIPEPRWQQVVSVIGVLVIVAVYLWVVLAHR